MRVVAPKQGTGWTKLFSQFAKGAHLGAVNDRLRPPALLCRDAGADNVLAGTPSAPSC